MNLDTKADTISETSAEEERLAELHPEEAAANGAMAESRAYLEDLPKEIRKAARRRLEQ